MLVMHRPAHIESDMGSLDAEYRAARWTYHRLIDFEDQHEAVLNAAAERAAPGILRVGRILARLARRARRAERSSPGTWAPNPKHALASRLRTRLHELRKQRNASTDWAEAKAWPDEEIGEAKRVRRRRAKPPEKVPRRKGETEEAYAKRFALLTTDETEEHFQAKLANPPRDTRRDMYRKELYRERRIYWGTWDHLIDNIDRARKDVLKLRQQGMPASIKRPRWSDESTIVARKTGFRVVSVGRPWWVLEMRLGTDNDQWVRFRAKCGNWHRLPPHAQLVEAKLTRQRDGERWRYSMSLTVDMPKDTTPFARRGTVALDWGHREHGHDRAAVGMRAFTWLGDDGQRGEVLLPVECRKLLDEVDAMKARVDHAWNVRRDALGIPERSRHKYRQRLMISGVKTAEQTRWLHWEMRYERRMAQRRRRIIQLRKECYLATVRRLRMHYARFAVEDQPGKSMRQQQTDEQMIRRRRANRELTARYEFVQLCERFGGELVSVPARNTTRECPDCGEIADENGAELLIVCPGCGRTRDRDHGAARVILRRATEALAEQDASP